MVTIQGFVVSQVQGNNILLFLLLIVLFVVAYKVLRAVINTAIVAVLSGVFLVVLDYLGIGPPATVNGFMVFMVLGTALFITYSALATLIRTTSGVIGVLEKLFGWLFKPFDRGKKGSKKGGKEKEIVLEELKDE